MTDNENNHDSWVDDVAGKNIVIDNGIHVADEPLEEKKKHWLRHRVTFFAFIVIVVAALGWLMAGVFLTEVRIGNTVTSARQSDDALRQTVKVEASNFRLKIIYPDGSTKNYPLGDMGLKVDEAKTIQQIREREQDFSRRLAWWWPTAASLVLRSDDTKRNTFITERATVTIQPAASATISVEDGEVVITDSVAGKHYGLDDPVNTLERAAAGMRSEPLKLQALSTRPAITSKQLVPYRAKLKNILNQSVVFTIGTEIFRATTDEISKWIEISSGTESKKIEMTVNSGLVEEYLTAISAPFVRQSKDQVEFVRDDGTRTVLVAGVQGNDIVDKKDVAAKVAKNLLENKPFSQTLRIDTADFETVSANAYDKWIEVDLTDKQMYLYEQNKLVKTYPVSAGAPATPTVKGQYAIYAKIEQQDMRGLNVDGTSYFQPDVAWVSYFYKDYAIHGNYWRPLSWFGRINSSHGCVSLPNMQAQWVYDWAVKGTQVIVHD